MDMSGYTKLFSSIVTSTIWREPNEVRIVWITMLALADRDGEVHASIPGLADMARVSIEQCEASLTVLDSPDKYSRTKDNEGRRIESIDGGWRLLNHPKYRRLMSSEERKDYFRVKKAEQRARAKDSSTMSTNVKDGQRQGATSQQSPHIAEAEAEADSKDRIPPPNPRGNGVEVNGKEIYPPDFLAFWEKYPKKKSKGDALKAWKKLRPPPKPEEYESALAWQSRCDQWTKDGGQFIPHPATWLNDRSWEDEPPPNGNRSPGLFKFEMPP